MSDPIRWDVSMTQDGIGRFVSYHDYAMKDEQCEALSARVAELEESLHLANGTAELAMWHRDIAEEALAKREAVPVGRLVCDGSGGWEFVPTAACPLKCDIDLFMLAASKQAKEDER